MKLKILLVGSIGENVQDLVDKLSKLQKSKAGPFDACFCVGSCSKSITDYSMPLPVYLQDCTRITIAESSDTAEPMGIQKLNSNLFSLQGGPNKYVANIWTIPVGGTDIVVASVPPFARIELDETKELKRKISHESFVGCDLLLTSESPQGIDKLLPPDLGCQGSFDIADIALRARPRYHIAPHTLFSQSHPFVHLAASSSSFTPKHNGRFISLAPVVSVKTAKEKGKSGKFIHAIGITPLQQMAAAELDEKPDNLQNSPYTDESYGIHGGQKAATEANIGLSEAQARRLMAENSQQDYRWKQKRKEVTSNQEVDEAKTTLFVHGLHKDVSGQLQADRALLLQAFQMYGVERIRRPPSKGSYAFLDFNSHEEARKCLEMTKGETTVAGIHLTLNWANASGTPQQQTKKRRLTEADAINSPTLYFRLPKDALESDIAMFSESLRKLAENTLESALGDPDISAENEPALQVKLRSTDDTTKLFGFLDFASHAAASMTLASLTESTDGGELKKKNEQDLSISELPNSVYLHWAPEKKHESSFIMETASGIKFERQHFPADSRTDCWFCLASDSCEKHLITSVHNQCYLAMPKGPAHKEGHILIVPVTHTSRGALSDADISSEVDILKEKLREHASKTWGLDLFVFERAMQTKGGYHTHIQCVPIPLGLGVKLQATMINMGKRCGFNLREINSDLSIGALVGDGYFYAEVPGAGGNFQRFLYNADEGPTVPLQFGREILAAVLDEPNLAHWKACVLSEEDETKFSMKFRESFSKFEP
mmetsp:Transcript_30299/g.44812  ORF Transcript_30299/g.44812 Transcript_30299/m.44812 type:complete len:773 (-) Transcript_30299:365-2683(-)